MTFALGLCAGIVAASVLFLAYFHPSGTLKIDHTDIAKDVYRIDINSIDELAHRKHVVLKVDNNANLSQK